MNSETDFYRPLKVFKQKKYAEDFLSGKLYMNTLKYFICLEESFENNMSDKHEGLSAYIIPDDMNLDLFFTTEDGKTEKVSIKKEDLSDASFVRYNQTETLNVFCFTLLSSDGVISSEGISKENINYINSLYELDVNYLVQNLGSYAVVIHDTSEFINRIKTKVNELKKSGSVIHFGFGKVNYFDEEKSHVDLEAGSDYLSCAFRKKSSYKHQKECRLVIDFNENVQKRNDGSFTLDIGDLSDIAFYIPTEKLNDIKFQIQE